MSKPRKIATCIGCGCDDLHACVEEVGAFLLETPKKVAAMEACHWLRLDRDAGLGVCSACPGSVGRWDAGERAPTEPCLICQPAARAALDPEVRALVEELIAEYPPDRVPGIPCWNCFAGYTGEVQRIRELMAMFLTDA